MLKKGTPAKMRIHFHAVHWEEFMRRERDDKMSNGLLTRALMNDEPLPWRRMEVDVDTDVDPTWLAATGAVRAPLARDWHPDAVRVHDATLHVRDRHAARRHANTRTRT